MSESWPPQQSWPPPQGGHQSPYGPQNPDYGYPDAGYDYPDAGYGRPAPNSSRRRNEWPPAQGGGDPWSGDSGTQGPYPYPQQPQYPQYQQAPQYQPYQQYPQYPQDPYGSPYGYNQPPAPKKRRNWLLPVILVVVLLLVAAGGAYALTRGKAPTSTPPTAQGTAHAATATPGIPRGFRAYSDNETHIKFAIPQGWATTGTPGGATTSPGLQVESPNHSSDILVKDYKLALNNTATANGALAGAAGSGNVANKQGPTNVRFAGATWVQESGDVTSDGVKVHVVILVTTHNNATYLIGFLAEASAFSSANTKYFQPMQKSFAFTK